MHIMCWKEGSYEILNQNIYKSKLPLLHVFHGCHEFSFLKIYIFMLIK